MSIVGFLPSHLHDIPHQILTEQNNPEPNPEDCPCEGTGYIIHADGHKTECPCEEGKCDCLSDPEEEEEEEYIPHTPLKNFFRGLFRRP